MGLSAPISSALNTLTFGAMGQRDPEPIVLRDAGDGSYIRQAATGADVAYQNTQLVGLGASSIGYIGVMGGAEALFRGLGFAALEGRIGTFSRLGVRAVQTGAALAAVTGAAMVLAGGLQSDKVQLIYEDENGNAKLDDQGNAVTEVIDRSEYEAGVTNPS